MGMVGNPVLLSSAPSHSVSNVVALFPILFENQV